MKRLVSLIIFLVVGGIVWITYGSEIKNSAQRWVDFSFCDRPMTYRIVEIDPKFNISEKDLRTQIEAAASMWSGAVDKKLFEYDENGILKISLKYDERQEILRTISKLDAEVAEQKDRLDNTNAEYEQRRSKIENELSELNDTIDYWNAKGGAPEEVYEKLIAQQKALQKKIDDLNKVANNINNTVTKVNDEIHDLNNKVNYFNSIVQISPEMGLYTSGINTIEIFFFADQNELKHVMAHELGHAIGLPHVEDENAIMNPITSESTTLSETDKKAIVDMCENKNRLDLIKSDLENAIYTFRTWLYYKAQNL